MKVTIEDQTKVVLEADNLGVGNVRTDTVTLDGTGLLSYAPFVGKSLEAIKQFFRGEVDGQEIIGRVGTTLESDGVLNFNFPYTGQLRILQLGETFYTAQAKTYADEALEAVNSIGTAVQDAQAAATAAEASNVSATVAANNSANSATAASTSETNAAASASDANTSALAALTSENNAATSEGNAATSAANALTSENNAAASATAAAASAASVGAPLLSLGYGFNGPNAGIFYGSNIASPVTGQTDLGAIGNFTSSYGFTNAGTADANIRIESFIQAGFGNQVYFGFIVDASNYVEIEIRSNQIIVDETVAGVTTNKLTQNITSWAHEQRRLVISSNNATDPVIIMLEGYTAYTAAKALNVSAFTRIGFGVGSGWTIDGYRVQGNAITSMP